MAFSRGPEFDRPSRDLVARLAAIEVATLGHTTDFGFPRGLTSIVPGSSFVGSALTVKIPHLDSAAVHYAIDLIEPGDVLVIDQSGDDHRSSFGGGLAQVAMVKGAVGAVSNGSTNDVAQLRSMHFPVFSRGATPHTTRVLGIEGAINVPVSIGGVVVMPGDIVLADEDGVAVISTEGAEELADMLAGKEARLRQRDSASVVRDGGSFSELTGAKDKVEASQGRAR
jgi:regulator of RNase E activity RraA